MRIVVVAGLSESLIRFRGALIDSLITEGHEVHVAAPDMPEGGFVHTALSKRGCVVHEIRLERTGINPVSDLKTIWDLYRLMRRIRPQSILSYTIKPVIYGSLAARWARVPKRFALITGLGYAFTGEARGMRYAIQKLSRSLYRLSLTGCNLVFFQNPDDQELFKQLRLVPARVGTKVVHGSGVDLIEFSPTPLPTRPSFLLISRLLGDKGVREYVSASLALKKKYPDATFSLVGWIDVNPDAVSQEELDSWSAAGINYLGRVSDVRPAISQCSVYVLPSYREGTPRTVLEAMAMGRPIVTTDAPGCRETVEDGLNGYLVPVKAVDELAFAMERFIIDSSLVSSMGRRSRQAAEDRYDVHKVNKVIVNEMELS